MDFMYLSIPDQSRLSYDHFSSALVSCCRIFKYRPCGNTSNTSQLLFYTNPRLLSTCRKFLLPSFTSDSINSWRHPWSHDRASSAHILGVTSAKILKYPSSTLTSIQIHHQKLNHLRLSTTTLQALEVYLPSTINTLVSYVNLLFADFFEDLIAFVQLSHPEWNSKAWLEAPAPSLPPRSIRATRKKVQKWQLFYP